LQSEARKVFTHVVAYLSPDTKQDALTLVVTGPIAVRLTKVAGDNWTINGGHYFGQCDAGSISGQYVASTDTSLGANQANALETEQDLFQIGLGESRALRQVTN
jgi:hypothetical protein